MYNTNLPTRAELPSSQQLLRSTVIAVISALVLLAAVVLPAEYAIDPTGVGARLGLTQMGTIKQKLAQEAVADAAGTAKTAEPPAVQSMATASASKVPSPVAAKAPVSENVKANSNDAWRDEMTFTLKPGEGTEVKMRMRSGEVAQFTWAVQGGVVNYDTHGEGGGRSISYEKGRAAASSRGEIKAAFDGAHGWYWRNRGDAPVTVVLRTAGKYSDVARVK